MDEKKIQGVGNKTYSVQVFGFLLWVIGGVIVAGWFKGIPDLLQLTPHCDSPDFISGINFLLIGVLLATLNTQIWLRKVLLVGLGGYLIAASGAIILFTLFEGHANITVNIIEFLLPSVFPETPVTPVKFNVALTWFFVGVMFLMTIYVKRKATYLVMKTINLIIFTLSIIGFVNFTNKFDLLYSWYQSLILPFHISLGMMIVCVTLLGNWGKNAFFQGFYKGKEDQKILLVTGSFLGVIMVTSGIVGFTLDAFQNEKLLKNTLAQSLALKSSVISKEVKEAIAETESFVTFPNLIEYIKTAPHVIAQTREEVEKLFDSQQISFWVLYDEQGVVIAESREKDTRQWADLPLPQLRNIFLSWANGWQLTMTRDVVADGEKIGVLMIRKPMPVLDSVLVHENHFGRSETKTLCTIINPSEYRCFSSSSTKRFVNILSRDALDPNTPIVRSLNKESGLMLTQDNIHKKDVISAFDHISTLGLGLVLSLDRDELYENMNTQLRISLPMLLWFIIFSVFLISWNVVPIARKMIRSEQEATQTTGLLKESENRLKAIVNNIGEAILVADEEGVIESSNNKACDIFKGNSQEILGKSIGLFFVNAEESPLSMMHQASQKMWSEATMQRLNQDVFPSEYYISELAVGNKKIYILIVRDITERKKIELRIQDSENRFRSSFDFAPIGMALVSVDGRWMQVNQALSNILGYSQAELLGNDFFEIIHSEDRDLSHHTMRPVFEDQLKTASVETRYISESGRVIWIYLSVFMLHDDEGKPLYLIAQMQDITERKRVEEELKTANDELKRRFDELELHTQEAALMSEMSRILQSCLTLEEAYAPLNIFCRQLMPHLSGRLYFTHTMSNFIEVIASWGQSQQPDLFMPKECWALRSGQVHQRDEKNSHIFCPHVHKQETIGAHLCIPMMAQGESIGLLYLEFPKNSEGQSVVVDESVRLLAQGLADQLALALSNIKLRESLHHQSMHDPLTGLYNRRYLEEFMKMKLLQASRKQQTLVAIMLDVDHFKQFNDTFGHEAGDLVLQEIAGVLQKHVRDTDIACRMGGEEFMVLIPEVNLELAWQRAEEIRVSINNLHLTHNGESLGALSVSLGVSVYPDHASNAQTLFDTADQALYHAKHTGRNRIVVYGQGEV